MDLAQTHVPSLAALMKGRAHILNIGTANPVFVLDMHAACQWVV